MLDLSQDNFLLSFIAHFHTTSVRETDNMLATSLQKLYFIEKVAFESVNCSAKKAGYDAVKIQATWT
jgi:hypothetical protein